MWGSRRIAGPWTCNPKAEGSLCCSLPFSQQFPSPVHCWQVVKPYHAKGAEGEACAQASVLGQEAGLSSREWSDGPITTSLPFWDLPVGLEWFFTQPSCISQQVVLHIPPSSCPRNGGQFLLLWELSITCTALLGESSSEAQSLSSSPPLTTVSPLTHDWQQQAAGGRPAGHKPAPGLA